MKHLKKYRYELFIIAFILFIVISYTLDYQTGKTAGVEFVNVIKDMLIIIPASFMLVALFEVWIKPETVEKHLGKGNDYKGYIWALLLGGMSVGGIFVALPVAYTLFKKGASLKIIFSYLGFATICRIPMTIFEISFMGLKFTAVRLISGIILMLISGIIMGSYFEKRDYEIKE